MNKKARIAAIVSIALVLLVLAVIVLAAPRKKCNNSLDDDNDGLVDYPKDPGCRGKTDNTETSTSLVCDDGVDQTNDRDLLADFRLSNGDPGCVSATDSSEVDGECDDLLDNDNDLLSDYPNDPDCSSFSDPSEAGPAQCNDGIDNDNDTKTDYGTNQLTHDSKCASASDNDESPKDSCTDTEGSAYSINSGIQGTVSGDDESVPYSLTDFCVDAVTLTEHYCGIKAQDYAPLNININCAMNQTTSCSNGACI